MSRRTELYLFAVLLVVLGFVLYRHFRPASISISDVHAADATFHPLDVQEPELHLDLLENLGKEDYTARRNIFTAQPIPPPQSERPKKMEQAGPPLPVAPPPLQVPVKYFGYASDQHSGRRVGFFASGDDVLVLAQGDEFLGRYRLMSMNNSSAEVLEISSGRKATLPITQPPGQASN